MPPELDSGGRTWKHVVKHQWRIIRPVTRFLIILSAFYKLSSQVLGVEKTQIQQGSTHVYMSRPKVVFISTWIGKTALCQCAFLVRHFSFHRTARPIAHSAKPWVIDCHLEEASYPVFSNNDVQQQEDIQRHILKKKKQ